MFHPKDKLVTDGYSEEEMDLILEGGNPDEIEALLNNTHVMPHDPDLFDKALTLIALGKVTEGEELLKEQK